MVSTQIFETVEPAARFTLHGAARVYVQGFGEAWIDADAATVWADVPQVADGIARLLAPLRSPVRTYLGHGWDAWETAEWLMRNLPADRVGRILTAKPTDPESVPGRIY